MIASKVAEFNSSVVSTTVSSETPPDPNVVEAPQAESQFSDITEFAWKLDDRFFFLFRCRVDVFMLVSQ
jgi:hypothetical protein